MNINTSYEQNYIEQSLRDQKELENKRLPKSGLPDDLKGIKSDLLRESASISKSNDISGKNEAKLSKKAQEFLKDLRKKYGDYDFMVGNTADDLKALSKSGSKEYSVIFSSAELEKMASNEEYAQEKMQEVAGAIEMTKKIAEEYGFGSDPKQDAVINKIGIIIGDDGNMKIFAELEKASSKQRDRIAANREKKAEEKKSTDKTKKNNPYERDNKPAVKRLMLEADSMDELIDRLKNIDWDKVDDSHSGDRVNFAI